MKKTNIIKKAFALTLGLLLVAAVLVPSVSAQTVAVDFISATSATHWGRSDLRAYLNGVEKIDNTLPLNSTNKTHRSSGYYESYFLDTEYSLILPFEYYTNVFDSDGSVTYVYSTTDKFWLPSGKIGEGKILSWSKTDISDNDEFLVSRTTEAARLIPISYWANSCSFLRSAHRSNERVSASNRGLYTSASNVSSNYRISPLFKLDISNVSFASVASAAVISSNGGAMKTDISGSANFGKKTETELPDYGMYLKTVGDDAINSFDATYLSLEGTTLTVNYTGASNGSDVYTVVQAYREDDLIGGTTVYSAAVDMSSKEAGTGSLYIDVLGWGLSSLDGYTVKVWEEYSTNASLAKASSPVTFVGSNGALSRTNEGEIKNLRVFSTKAELQTSWGDLTKLNTEEFATVVAGNSYTVGTNKVICGVDPTNQKIYFGAYDGKPLQFWIAGRENADGEIDANGNIMTLYTAKSVGTTKFNGSESDYTGNGKEITFTLEDVNLYYTGEYIEFPEEKIKAMIGGGQIDKSTLTFEYRTSDGTWYKGLPKDAGTYDVRACAPATDMHETVYSNNATVIILYLPTPQFEIKFINANVYDDVYYLGEDGIIEVIGDQTYLVSDFYDIPSYGTSVQLNYNYAEDEYAVRFKESDTSALTDIVKISDYYDYVWDVKAPEISIDFIGEDKSFDTFDGKITFDESSYTKAEEFFIDVYDENGIANNMVYYYIATSGVLVDENSTEEDILAALKTVDWAMISAYEDNPVYTYIPKAQKAVIYAGVADKAGNVSYVSTSGVILKGEGYDISRPTSAAMITYSGEYQELVNVKDFILSGCGPVEYALSQSNIIAPTKGWSASIPSARDVENYYVWFRTLESELYEANEPEFLTVETIHSLDLIDCLEYGSIENKDYDGEPVDKPFVTVHTDFEYNVAVKYKPYGADDNEYSYVTPSDAGNYTYLIFVDFVDGNVEDIRFTSDFVIYRIETADFTDIKWQNSKVYDGDPANAPIIDCVLLDGYSNTVSVLYSKADGGEWTATAPTDAGEYRVKVLIDFNNENVDDYLADSSFEIERRPVSVSWDNVSFIYDGERKLPSATLSGILPGDACTLTVSGARRYEGTHTAKAEIDNENYYIAEGETCEFEIKLDVGKLLIDTATDIYENYLEEHVENAVDTAIDTATDAVNDAVNDLTNAIDKAIDGLIKDVKSAISKIKF